MSSNSAGYLRCLSQFGAQAGWRETARLLFSIIATKLGATAGLAAQRSMQRWAFFQMLQQASATHVSRVQPQEFRVGYVEPDGKSAPVEVALRVPDCDSSDARVFQQVFLSNDYGQVLDWFFATNSAMKIKTILDIGANIGCSAIFFSTRLPVADIFCLEPEETNYARLMLNLALNPNLRIRSHRAALWTHSRILNCSHDFRDGKEWGSRFVEIQPKGQAQPQTVAGIDITELGRQSGFDQVDFLKMDIEGAEADLLRSDSFLSFLKNHVRCLAVEVHEEFIQIEEAVAILKSLGFHTKIISEFVCGVKVA